MYGMNNGKFIVLIDLFVIFPVKINVSFNISFVISGCDCPPTSSRFN